MTTAIIFPTKPEADAYSAKVDTAFGYPKPGVDIGGGIHAPAALSVTTRQADVLEKPTKDAYAYPVDAASLAKEPAPAGKPPVTLDASWDGAKVASDGTKDAGAGGSK